MKKAPYYFLFALFGSFAIMQLNDPDWYLWIWPYFVVCVVLILKIKNKRVKYFHVTAIVILGIWFLSYVPDLVSWLRDGTPNITSQMKAESMYIELIRESLGLLISLVMLVLLVPKD